MQAAALSEFNVLPRNTAHFAARAPISLSAWRAPQLLDAVDVEPAVTQRGLAAGLGVAFGLTHLCLAGLIHEGYIKGVTMRPNRQPRRSNGGGRCT